MNKSIVIHNDNINLHHFNVEQMIKFDLVDKDLDEYISTEIIPILQKLDFDVIFIKDKLSSNYLDFYGFRVAYHIRFSEKTKYLPVIILSDLTIDILARLEDSANILFTKNIFVIPNTKQEIEKKEGKIFKELTPEQYDTYFLNKIQIEQPKDYLSHHDIANEWSIYRWAEYLDVHTPDIKKIRDDISSMLYFKYLQEKFPIKRNLFTKYKQKIHGSGKILYIDDEWEKGWKSIFKHLSQENQDYSLETVDEVYKDKTQETIITFIMEKVVRVYPDVVILDMRLHADDFLENVGLSDFTGIQIFNKIKEINPGIQVVIFTASSNSLLLDELYSYDSSILGYVKKEHPKNYNLTTQGNINKLITLINKGLEEKYLKNIYDISSGIINILNIDLNNPDGELKAFKNYNIRVNKYLPQVKLIDKETRYVFNTLNSNTSNKYAYAMLSITRSLEAVSSIFIKERQFDNVYWDNEECFSRKFEDKITDLMRKLGYRGDTNDLNPLITRRNRYVHFNEAYTEVTKDEIELWFKTLLLIIEIINNPPNYTLCIPE